ncbi:polysaccharide deacetylase family sporulation protein PdaB [Paenibacillus larvae]|uniref:Polysaccharide deacetylase family sporulation protein PdaB n=1 Tax=Paenibacillus larvae TaxID=1464 RepID=A0AAP5JTY8_9BACL|nr:polysaccharide deacetylase family sporulation protein PdaB [Paenibacillus larvae]AQR78479.1 polysaccharide deacetylase family sporulation protein PdaB [Paenibacillus larvae subsp. larvae]AVF20273.1 putative polysaccharide deacetylase PdaB [Paenibacillus larvae subsp. larvae]ETK28796.1 putative polysaccharide deacetylase PdaB [Paenibacillus larvae subsp. larvae DSM 25719]MCY7478623.1 polysaccharide deacetylase family sporulation protein PdaB [Paenibacillus larvae]MCY7488328.1 polysaccharide 
MNYFYVMNGKKLKQAIFIIAALLFAAGIVYAERENISAFAGKDTGPKAIYSVPTDKKVIALTFDISWGDKRAEPILKILEEKGVKNATFFLSSPWTKSHPEIVKKIKDGGFEIGSHGHKHVNYSSLNDEEIRKQIQTADSTLTDAVGQKPNLIRMPNGDFDKRVLKIAKDLGYSVIQWDTDSLDWMNIGTDKIIDRVMKKVHPGDIVLMHASDSCKQTHEALPVIIDQLKAKGYEFVTVGELLKQAKAENKDVQDQAANLHIT